MTHTKSYPAIASVIPHKPPMVLLDAIVDLGEMRIVTSVRIGPDSMFLRDGKVRSIVAIEYMAQTVAAYAGMQRHSLGAPPKVGYIIGVPLMQLKTDSFQLGDTLQVHAEHLWGEGELGRIACRITRSEIEVASATLSVYSGDVGS
ncbi:MAG: 3-hydroxylacyl-ACP dehydratase [Myxococcales bacterium]|nr:3-hydroxylacyl-ACP dehydratase [Myxococcales bacterium]